LLSTAWFQEPIRT